MKPRATKPTLIALTAFLLLTACHAQPKSKTPPPPPTLHFIELHQEDYAKRIALAVSITPDGVVRYEKIENRSYGDEDVGPPRIETRRGQLPPDKITALIKTFKHWDDLTGKPYAGPTDGPQLLFRYGAKTISGGADLPSNVKSLRDKILNIGKSMPVVQ